jgi:TetR/AcrR family transcriptional repressor of nem operon
MSGRPKIFDEEEVINKAIEVFWKKGYEASSAEELLKAMGIGKSSFYLAFKGGKQELFERAMAQRSDNGIKQMQKGLKESKNKIEFLKSRFMNTLDPKSERFSNGCLMGNSIAELSNINPELKDRAAFFLVRLEKIFLAVLKEAKAKGELKSKEDPALLAKQLITFWNGLNISVRVYQEDTKPLKKLIEMQFKSLQ